MAKNNGHIASNGNGNGHGKEPAQADAWSTEGFTRLTTDVELYYSPSGPKGEPVGFRGIVLERRERPADKVTGKVSSYFIVRATAPFVCKDGKKGWSTAEVGDHVWVDERASYARIHDMLPRATPSGTVAFEVLYQPTEKVSLGGGRTLWKGELFTKVLQPHQHDLAALGAFASPTSAARLPEHVEGELEGSLE